MISWLYFICAKIKKARDLKQYAMMLAAESSDYCHLKERREI